MNIVDYSPKPILVLGATGKTGRRVTSRLRALGHTVRLGSRQATPPFDWTRRSGWSACLENVESVYVSYPSDLPIPGSLKIMSELVELAERRGVRRLVLLTGRGEEEAQAWEEQVQASGLEWTIIRSSWFQQNFTEGPFAGMVEAGELALPAGDIPEPFVDIDDIAEVAVTALTQPGHSGKTYEVTGPRLMTFGDVAEELSKARGHPVRYQPIPLVEFVQEFEKLGAPDHIVWLMEHLFGTALDGRNAHLSTGVQRALGRPPKDFSRFAQQSATTNTGRNAA